MRKSFVLRSLFVGVVAIAGCSDDDAEPMKDAGPDGSAGTGKAGSGGGGASGAGRDGGDSCAAYPEEPMPLWPHADEPVMDARRAPLAALCTAIRCERSLAEFMAPLECMVVTDDLDGGVGPADFDGGVDAGVQAFWHRSEGCGTVQFISFSNHYRNYNFDADSGELIGYAMLDDAGTTPLSNEPGSCSSAGWVAGEFRTQCTDEKLSVCLRRR